jgi:hypothetical protein
LSDKKSKREDISSVPIEATATPITTAWMQEVGVANKEADPLNSLRWTPNHSPLLIVSPQQIMPVTNAAYMNEGKFNGRRKPVNFGGRYVEGKLRELREDPVTTEANDDDDDNDGSNGILYFK